MGSCETSRLGLRERAPSVLIVDDSAESLLVLTEMVEELGYRVLQARDALQALQLCTELSQPCLAILVDQYMPGVDGWEFLQRIRAQQGWEAVATVLVSASAMRRPRDFPGALSFDLVLNKPMDSLALKCFLCRRLHGVARSPESCWHERVASAVPELPALPADALQQFKALLDMGRLVGLARWASELGRDARYAAAAHRVAEHVQAADLPALNKLLTQWQQRAQ